VIFQRVGAATCEGWGFMLEWIRKEAVERPKVIGALMVLIGGIFVLSMGWWGFSASRSAKSDVIAKVNGVPIKVDDYSRDYLIMKDNYTRLLRGDLGAKILKDLNFPGLVLRNMIYRQLWIDEGRNLGIHVSDQTVVQEIARIPFFQEGTPPVFSKNAYVAFLKETHQTAESFEESVRMDVLVQRAQLFVRAAQTIGNPPPQPQGTPTTDANAERVRLQNETVEALQNQLETKAHIDIDQKVFREISRQLL